MIAFWANHLGPSFGHALDQDATCELISGNIA
jgi:hypothetical protein